MRERLPSDIERTLGLEPGERLLWASARSGTDAHAIRFDQAAGLMLGVRAAFERLAAELETALIGADHRD